MSGLKNLKKQRSTNYCIKNGLHMNGSDRLSVNAQKAFSKSLEDLSTLLKTSKGISDIRLSHSQNEFVEKINSILKDLPTEEQLKFQELFGFKIVNGKLTGYPNVNISVENYTNKELFNKIKQEVEAYLDNQVIIENNPQLKMLKKTYYNYTLYTTIIYI